jgi:hypothetical protein
MKTVHVRASSRSSVKGVGQMILYFTLRQKPFQPSPEVLGIVPGFRDKFYSLPKSLFPIKWSFTNFPRTSTMAANMRHSLLVVQGEACRATRCAYEFWLMDLELSAKCSADVLWEMDLWKLYLSVQLSIQSYLYETQQSAKDELYSLQDNVRCITAHASLEMEPDDKNTTELLN